MAPIGDSSSRVGKSDKNKAEDSGKNLWNTILSEVQTSSAQKLPSSKSVIVLGDNESGKTTLIAKLQGTEDPKKGCGLEFHYFDVSDEYREDVACPPSYEQVMYQTRLGVYILDGDPTHTGLLKFALTEESFAHTLVLLVVSMAHPWSIVDALKNWTTILRDHIDSLRIPSEDMKEYEESLVRHFQEYTEPSADGHSVTSPPKRRDNPLHPVGGGDGTDRVVIPLEEDTLTQNLGIPIVVVVTKSDAISTLEKEQDYREEHFDFIQQHIRKFCLNYGASLFYTSVKEEKNCDLLYKYLLHRIYGFPFSQPAFVVEKDSVFVPCGWDSAKKISILYDNMSSMKPDDAYADVIARPITRRTVHRDAEIAVEDEQAFLLKQQVQLSKAPVSRPEGSPSLTKPSAKMPSPRPGALTASPGGGGTPKKPDAGRGGPGASEGVLANFFNSLLNKKPGAGGSPVKTNEQASVSRDAAAELERMTRSKKTAAANQNSNS